MNVAILSASRKVWLVRAFQQAVGLTGGGRVFALDCDSLAASFVVADEGVVSPRSDAENFVPWLLEFCRRERIALIVPTRDEELPALAAAIDRFDAAGVRLLVSRPLPIAICQDKLRFLDFCRENAFAVPALVDDAEDDLQFPAFRKPRVGKAGRGARRVNSAAELRAEPLDPERELLQEFVEDPEYTVDVCADFEGRVISVVPRERVRVVGGESVVTRTVSDPQLEAETSRLVTALGLIGHVTVQAFRGARSIRFIEVNPRFGGAAALGFAAGCPTPEWLVRLTAGESVAGRTGRFTSGLWMFRHSTDEFVHEDALTDHESRAL